MYCTSWLVKKSLIKKIISKSQKKKKKEAHLLSFKTQFSRLLVSKMSFSLDKDNL